VLYIPVCPVTEDNARYLVRQRSAFLDGTPGPDFPGGKGEPEHVDRPGRDRVGSAGAMPAMGLQKLLYRDSSYPGAEEAVARANSILGL